MLRQDLSERSSELRALRVPFVHARVVLAERPTSARPGDEAIILGDGTIEGFVGGTCAETTVRDQSLQVLRSGEAMVLRITPTVEESHDQGKRVVHNPCLSGGTLEVYLEPTVPPPMLVVVGQAPIARALISVGAALRYATQSWDGTIPADAAAVVIASHGRDEEEALTAALVAGVSYVGLVASARRGAAVVAGLPVGDADKARVHTPAGLDIGANTSEEVALSILADIVGQRRRSAPGPARTGPVDLVERSTDPVCGMTVIPGDAALHVMHAGRTVWFCGRGCREAFAAEPTAYPA